MTLYSNAPANQNIRALLAVYNENGSLAGLKRASVILQPGDNYLRFEDINVSGVTGEYSVKCMFWTGLDVIPAIKPLTNVVWIRKAE